MKVGHTPRPSLSPLLVLHVDIFIKVKAECQDSYKGQMGVEDGASKKPGLWQGPKEVAAVGEGRWGLHLPPQLLMLILLMLKKHLCLTWTGTTHRASLTNTSCSGHIFSLQDCLALISTRFHLNEKKRLHTVTRQASWRTAAPSHREKS